MDPSFCLYSIEADTFFMHRLFIVIGILLSNLIAFPLANVPLWRLNYALVALPALFQACVMPFCVESPRYLVSMNDLDGALTALQKLRGQAWDVEGELQDIILGQRGASSAVTDSPTPSKLDAKKEQDAQEETDPSVIRATEHDKSQEAYGIRQLFTDPVVRRITLIVVVLHATQQFSAVNGVMYYSTIIFSESFNPQVTTLMATATSFVNLVVTLLAVALIDRLGRRCLLLVAQAGGCLTAITLVIGGYFQIKGLLVASVFLFVSSFAIGLGPIPWLITSELSPTHAASSMTAIATSVNWGTNFIIALVFPLLMDHLHSFSFLIFGGILFFSTLFTAMYVPETKGRSLEETYASFERAIRNKPHSDEQHN